MEKYLKPQLEVIELESEGRFCTSEPGIGFGDNPTNFFD